MKKHVKIWLIILVVFLFVIFFFIDKNDNEEVDKYMQYERNIEKNVIDYVGKVLDENYHYELIKTMCVIARTCYMYENKLELEKLEQNTWNNYLLNNKNNNSKTNRGYDMKNKIKKAAKETRGEIMVYHENIIYPFYHYVSPRITRNEDKACGIKIPYLKIKNCSGDVESSEFIQIKYFNKNDIYKIIDLNSNTDNKKGELNITNIDKEGYVYGIKLNNKYDVDVYELISKLGLNSNNFTISTYKENSDIVRFVCRGKGSGMGLSIFDANKLAKEGLKYIDIINNYYKDIEIKKYVF